MESWKRIDKYQVNLKRKLGEGSYASVYLGQNSETGEKVAVKVIDRKMFMDSYNLKNLQSEIDIMKKVSHENIVKLHDVYQTANNMYIVTEYCQDGDLSYHLARQQNKIPECEAKRLIKQVMKGAKYLHNNGIIHRDLKPANILLKDGTCKISDFGFAKDLDKCTMLKSIVGTPLYMSPQILQASKYTSKSDLWSIGLIYYEMLHGNTPWPANNEIQLLNAIYSRRPVFSRDVSELSRDFIEKCLQISEKDRMAWEDAFEHKLLREFSRDPNAPKGLLSGEKENSAHNTSFTYIKNVPARLDKELSEKALRNMINLTPSKRKTPKTPSKSHSVAKFAGSRGACEKTPRSNLKSPFFFRH